MTTPPEWSNPSPSAGQPPPPLDGFAAQEFRARRDRLRAACPDGIILVRGAAETDLPHNAPYRQNANFYYLTGINAPGSFLVMLPDDVPTTAAGRDYAPDHRDMVFIPQRSPAAELWTGAKLGPGDETARASGLDAAYPSASLTSALSYWIQRNQRVYTVAPFGEHADSTREFAFMEHLRRRAPVVEFRDAGLPIARLRSIKSPEEIDRIRDAVGVTVQAHEEARSLIARTGTSEYEVEARVLETFRRNRATTAFPCIVGAGINGTVLHYEQNGGVCSPGDLVVVDIGARLGPYVGDITRTYPIGGRFSARQREIYGTVLLAQRMVVETFQPRRDTLRSLRDRCMEFLKQSPLRAEASDGSHSMDHFMPHGLSHHLGLDVHDAGDSELPLAPGAVITVEPGIYIPSECLGVRIEDDYLVTERGLERLGPALAGDPDEVEAAMA